MGLKQVRPLGVRENLEVMAKKWWQRSPKHGNSISTDKWSLVSYTEYPLWWCLLLCWIHSAYFRPHRQGDSYFTEIFSLPTLGFSSCMTWCRVLWPNIEFFRCHLLKEGMNSPSKPSKLEPHPQIEFCVISKTPTLVRSSPLQGI